MRDFSPFNFGLVVAYVVPGFVILWGLSLHSTTVAAWLAGPSLTAPSVGDLFYAMLASVACGMFANLVRWAVIDTIHHGTGVRLPPWDFSRLQERLDAYQLLIELHYKHYQYAANMLVAVVFAYVAFRSSPSGWATGFGMTDVGFVLVCVVLFLGSRDALRRYYRRAGELLSSQRKEVRSMANGGDKGHHDEKKVDRKESQHQPKKGTADGLKAKSASNVRAQ